jgi:iron complex transport system permease protein
VALVAGALLGLAGAILQSITRNPLAEPRLSGISSGGIFLIVLWLVWGLPYDLLPLVASVGGLLTGGLIFMINRRSAVKGQLSRSDPAKLALYGLVIAAILEGLTSLFLTTKQEFSSTILMWLIGSLNGRTWQQWNILWPYALVGVTLALLSCALANALSLGDEVAAGLGLSVEKTRAILFLIATLLTASAVAVVGAIGFVGLIGPHIARYLTGQDARRLFLASALVAAALLLGADWLGQFLTRGNLPAGVVTAFLGVPFFLYLTLWKKKAH